MLNTVFIDRVRELVVSGSISYENSSQYLKISLCLHINPDSLRQGAFFLLLPSGERRFQATAAPDIHTPPFLFILATLWPCGDLGLIQATSRGRDLGMKTLMALADAGRVKLPCVF